ncbi:MAG TPA: PA2779 family protein [Xanthomonadales bacterium]|nr:PA2779 family protein [Xanthomonadales bacterium]
MTRKIVSLILSVSLLFVGFTGQVAAAVVGTQQAMSIEQRQGSIDHIQNQLQRADVQQAMIEMGVDPEQALLRVASLSDQELVQLNEQIDTLPAGGDSVLAIIGIVFLVLLILELTGLINIFNKT